MAKVNVSKDLEQKTLTIETIIAGPKDKVWQAFTEKEYFEKWWGPEGWDTTTKEFNFEAGGKIHYGMKCVDKSQGEWYGQEAWALMEIKEINPKDSFTYIDYFCKEDDNDEIDTNMPTMTVTNEFIAEGDNTKLISTTKADTVEQLEQVLEMGMAEGLASQLDKLDALLAK
ncbi:MAG: SRPBCC domain-containing protein [Micrococcaceae bacterium]